MAGASCDLYRDGQEWDRRRTLDPHQQVHIAWTSTVMSKSVQTSTGRRPAALFGWPRVTGERWPLPLRAGSRETCSTSDEPMTVYEPLPLQELALLLRDETGDFLASA